MPSWPLLETVSVWHTAPRLGPARGAWLGQERCVTLTVVSPAKGPLAPGDSGHSATAGQMGREAPALEGTVTLQGH